MRLARDGVVFPDSSDAMLEAIDSDMGWSNEQIISWQVSTEGSSSLKGHNGPGNCRQHKKLGLKGRSMKDETEARGRMNSAERRLPVQTLE